MACDAFIHQCRAIAFQCGHFRLAWIGLMEPPMWLEEAILFVFR